MKYTVLIAGSTQHTRICAEALLEHDSFEIVGILTPPPKPIGRKQVITPNPLHEFATAHTIPVVHVEKRIDQSVQHKIEELPQPDFVLVVDFGYIVPNWLLELPQIAPLNIHPSTLPRWRGSSPGQFVLLYGENQSSVSVIVMNELLDQGALVAQLPFTVAAGWTQTEYYGHAFAVVTKKLPAIMLDLAQEKIHPTPQPIATPTPIASRFTKEDGFIPWELVITALAGAPWDTKSDNQHVENLPLAPVLSQALRFHHSPAKFIYCASHALAPWPGVWTVVPTPSGEKRMKIISTELHALPSRSANCNSADTQLKTNTLNGERLALITVQLEGKSPVSWETAKESITE